MEEDADTEEVTEEPTVDKGLLGEYEMEVMMQRPTPLTPKPSPAVRTSDGCGRGRDEGDDAETKPPKSSTPYAPNPKVMMEKKDSGNALYMVMAVEFLTSLERNMPALEEATDLPGTLTDLLDHMFDLLENLHGKELVRSALMFLEGARHGLTQAELLQLLQSSDKELEVRAHGPEALGRHV